MFDTFILNFKRIKLKFTSLFRYLKYTQYLTYDRKSFVADFGGYLGLLLGSSLLTIYDLFKLWVARLISWAKSKGTENL